MTDRLDRILTHKVWGIVVFLAVMFVLFEFIFFGAKPLMDLIAGGRDALGSWVASLMEPGPCAGLLVDGVVRAPAASWSSFPKS